MNHYANILAPVPGEDGFFATRSGNILSIRSGELKARKLHLDKDGYECFNAPPRRHVHRLVLEAFVGPKPDGMQCRHLDGNKRNNNPDNLVWGTAKENHNDRREHGTFGHGDKNPRTRISDADVVEIRKMCIGWKDAVRLAKEYGVSASHIWSIKSGRFRK